MSSTLKYRFGTCTILCREPYATIKYSKSVNWKTLLLTRKVQLGDTCYFGGDYKKGKGIERRDIEKSERQLFGDPGSGEWSNQRPCGNFCMSPRANHTSYFPPFFQASHMPNRSPSATLQTEPLHPVLLLP